MQKKKYIRFLFFLLFFLSSSIVFSQEDRLNETIESLVEEIAANSDEELDYTTLFDDLNYFYNEPLDLNECTSEQLEKLHFLNQIQISNIIAYREKYGKILTIYELQLIEGLGKEDISLLLPFVTLVVGDLHRKPTLTNALKYGRHQIFLRNQFIVQEQAGYNVSDSIIQENPDKNRYLGDRMKYYVRYKYQYKNKLRWGVTMEKDAGEEFFRGTQKTGFDYYSAHIQINDVWKFEQINVGDYELQFGQGVTLWTGMSFGKSVFAMNIQKHARGIKKYSSTNENQFMRGIASTAKFGKFRFTGFFSYKSIDANITELDTIDNEDVRAVSSFQITGLHATPSEVSDKHSINEMIYGGNVSFRANKFKAGLTFVKYHYSTELEKNIKPYSQFHFQGSDNFNVGLDYVYQLKHIYLFGEVGMSQNLGLAFVNGALIPLVPQISLSILHRYYQKEYQAYYSNAFAEGSKISNEQGLYFGTEIYPIKKWKISAYFDAYSFPWLNSRTNSPTNGQDYQIQLDYNTSRYIKMYWRFKREIKPQNISEDNIAIRYTQDIDKFAVRYHISYQLTNYLRLSNRIELSQYNKGETVENGYMIFQDIRFKPNKIPITLYLRYAIFDAPYNARIYAYENDILYAFSIPGYFYKGYRTYITAKYDISKRITLWLRYSQFSYSNKDILGEGSLNEIDGNTKSEVKIQLRIKL